jgi:phosphoglucosamine mutase
MDRARFGTDGVRGVANVDLTIELALALGRASARTFGSDSFVVGRDTRRSGPMLQAAFSAGLAAEGVNVADVGVLPTPGVAVLSAERQVPAAMISASHNPFEDNGIKLFGPGGSKLEVAVESAIDAETDRILSGAQSEGGHGSRGVGTISSEPDAATAYCDALVAALKSRRLDGLSIVLDCANGAASAIAPSVFAALGAKVEVLCDRPDGTNINRGCGSTDPRQLIEAVNRLNADLGLAFDGDADRMLAVDSTGELADGDTLIALFAVDRAERGALQPRAVVVTVLSNMGLHLAMASRGIAVVETPVGDRSVLEALDAHGLAIGGEQSGHLVFRDLATTGDGILTGLLLADLVVRRGPLVELRQGLIEKVPQVSRNVKVEQPERLGGATSVWQTVSEVEAGLGTNGRVVLRASGTEPVIRVMVETRDPEAAESAVARIAAAVQESLGAAP